jgi:hypothetical protein
MFISQNNGFGRPADPNCQERDCFKESRKNLPGKGLNSPAFQAKRDMIGEQRKTIFSPLANQGFCFRIKLFAVRDS